MILIDSNLIIYAVQAQFEDLREWILEITPYYSIISRVEVLGFAKLQPTEKQALSELLDNLEIVYLNRNCYETAITLKQQRRMSLGDALIASTCLEYQQTLATRNVDDFRWIENLAVINPMVELGYSE
jgi:predicted nucleic acid-binding protein